jgi:hypothetical protein
MDPTTPAADARAEVPGRHERPPLTDYRLDLHTDPPPLTWVVESFVASGSVTCLAAKPSAGKTFLALQLADGVARGRAVAGIVCRPGGRALYVDGETPDELHRRARKLGVDPGAVVCIDGRAAGLRLERADDRDWLGEAIERERASLVVLDSFRALAPTINEDSSDDTAAVLRPLGDVARRTGAAIVLVHHASVKGGASSVRGSSAIVDHSDAAFGLSRVGGDPDVRRLHVVHRKFRFAAEPRDRLLRLSSDPLGFVAATRLSAQAELAERIDRLAAQVREDGGWPTRRIAEAVGIDLDNGGQERLLRRAMSILTTEARSWEKLRKGIYSPTDES